MKLIIFILNNPDLLETFLEALYENGIRGGTILDSQGMAKKVSDYDNADLLSVLKQLFVIPRDSNRTLLFCLKEEQLSVFKKVANEVTGGLQNPNTGVLMVLPLEEVFGSFVIESHLSKEDK